MKQTLLLLLLISFVGNAQISVVPNTALQGQTLDVRLSGAFDFSTVSGTANVSFFNAIAGYLDVNNVFADFSDNAVLANITVGPNAIDGYYTVSVTDSDLNTFTQPDGFFVGAASGASLYNSVTGTVRMDYNGDGCNSSDPTYPYMRIDATDGIVTRSTFTAADGSYHISGIPQTTVTVTPHPLHPNYFISTPASQSFTFSALNGSVETQDFCISANGIQPDAEVNMYATWPAPRPGFNTTTYIVYTNTGNQVISGSVVLNFNDTITDFFSATPSPATQSTGVLTWDFANMRPFESRTIMLTLRVHTPTEADPANLGDQLVFNGSMNYMISDLSQFQEPFTLTQLVVNSSDPNDKTCAEGSSVSPDMIGDYLHYTINFENVGTADALRVAVIDRIDPSAFDISSLQLINSSHAVNTRITDDTVQFIFDDINLAPNAHGHVTYAIKTRSDLSEGDSVSNTANIFFDFNFPILTNTATTTFETLATKSFGQDASLQVAPNPATDMIYVRSDSKISNVQLFDIRGRKLLDGNADDGKINVAGLNSGIYLVRVKTGQGTFTQRIIKK